MAHANVPKFGDWEGEDNVPYTVYFDKARKNRGGNPSDPSPASPPPTKPRAKSDEIVRTEVTRPTLESSESKDDYNLRQINKSPFRGTGPKAARPSEQNVDGNHGRSRVRPPAARGDESPDEGVTVPRFGEWDESDPQAAENYSHIFNMVREERNNGNVSTPSHPSRIQRSNEPKKCCCAWW